MSRPADQIIPLYQRHGAEWFALRREGSFAEQGWLDRFTKIMPRESKTVLDLGCGGGHPVAANLLENGFGVTGIDTSPELLALCRANLPPGEWIEADMRTLSLGRRFGGIVAWDSFFHLTPRDQRAMFAVFRDHALPGAALLFTSGPARGEAIGELAGQPLYHASLDPAEYRTELAEYGFEVIRHVAEDRDCGGHTVWLCRKQMQEKS